MTITDLLNMDMGDAIDWMEDNRYDSIFINKDFMEELDQDIILDTAEYIRNGERLTTSNNFNRKMVFALESIIKELNNQ